MFVCVCVSCERYYPSKLTATPRSRCRGQAASTSSNQPRLALAVFPLGMRKWQYRQYREWSQGSRRYRALLYALTYLAVQLPSEQLSTGLEPKQWRPESVQLNYTTCN